MKRKVFLRNLGLGAAATVLANNPLFARLLKDQANTLTMINPRAGYFLGMGGTIGFVITKKSIIVVDSQFVNTAKAFMTDVKTKSSLPIKLLINTHHHGDHTTGNIAFKGIVDHVLAHKNSKINQQAVAEERKVTDTQLYPDQTFETIWRQKLDGEKFTLSYFGAAHTNGDAVVHFKKAGIVHLGDLVFNRRFPYIDKKYGANIANWMVVLDKIVDKFEEKVTYICGHAGEGRDVVVTTDDIKAFRNYLDKLLVFTRAQIALGKTADEVIKENKVIPGAEEWQGEGIERSINAAYEELKS